MSDMSPETIILSYAPNDFVGSNQSILVFPEEKEYDFILGFVTGFLCASVLGRR